MLYQLIFIQIITFVFLIIFLRLLFHRHLNFALTRLHRINQDVFEKEEILKKKYQEMEKEREEKIKEAEQEVERIKNKARKEVLGIKEKILEQAQIEKTGIIEQARAEKKRRENEIDAKIVQKTISLASELIEYVFSKEIEKSIHIQLVDELISRLAVVDFRLASDISQTAHRLPQTAEVISVYSLKPEQKKRLLKTLSEKVGQNIELEEKIDKKMVGGVIVKLGDVVLDGSLRNKLEKAMSRVAGSGKRGAGNENE